MEHEQKALTIRRREELNRAREGGSRCKQNARRLEGQRREFECRREARRKAEEEAVAAAAAAVVVAAAAAASGAACAQTPNKARLGEYSEQGEAQPRLPNEEVSWSQPRLEQQPQLPGVERGYSARTGCVLIEEKSPGRWPKRTIRKWRRRTMLRNLWGAMLALVT